MYPRNSLPRRLRHAGAIYSGHTLKSHGAVSMPQRASLNSLGAVASSYFTRRSPHKLSVRLAQRRQARQLRLQHQQIVHEKLHDQQLRTNLITALHLMQGGRQYTIDHKMVDWQDRATCVLFGDAAGAAVLELGDNVLASQLSSNGNVDALNIPHVYGNSPFSHDDAQPSYLHMDGHEVYKFAVNAMATGLAETIQAAGLEQSQIDHVLPHQANMRIIQSAMKKLSIPHDRYRININRYGNTSSACIPVLLDELNQAGKLERGQILALTAFGGGLTNGAMVLRW